MLEMKKNGRVVLLYCTTGNCRSVRVKDIMTGHY